MIDGVPVGKIQFLNKKHETNKIDLYKVEDFNEKLKKSQKNQKEILEEKNQEDKDR